MRLTKFSDYVLRVLLLAASKSGQRATVEETAELFGISHAHLKKVVAFLSAQGYIATSRGFHGGFTLAVAPEAINLGRLLRQSEPDFALFECYRPDNACTLTPSCRLKRIGRESVAQFLKVYDGYTLADIAMNPSAFVPPAVVSPASGVAEQGPATP